MLPPNFFDFPLSGEFGVKAWIGPECYWHIAEVGMRNEETR